MRNIVFTLELNIRLAPNKYLEKLVESIQHKLNSMQFIAFIRTLMNANWKRLALIVAILF